jgi:hypothetical protein
MKGRQLMKMLVATIALIILAFLFAGCQATNTLAAGVSEKSISGSGTFVYSSVGLDAVTQTPELTTLFVWGDYTSIVPGDEVFRYEETRDASIFNSNASSYRKKVFFATGDKSRMDAIIKATIDKGGGDAGKSD